MNVRAKKHLGQHFLIDVEAAYNIAGALTGKGYNHVLEIGPGTGALTKHLVNRPEFTLHLVEIDGESINFLNVHYPQLSPRLHDADFLNLNLQTITNEQLAIAGNFPYNISSQIMFRVIENRHQIPEVVGMFQREVAQRICSGPGNKDYGILSVLLQAYYRCTYLFTLDEHAFRPPPKVKSGVIRCERLEAPLVTDELRSFFKTVVKTGFNQRRKTLRNSLKSVGIVPEKFSQKRPEQLLVEEFVELAMALRTAVG